jgi:hypothetical protein
VFHLKQNKNDVHGSLVHAYATGIKLKMNFIYVGLVGLDEMQMK